MNQLIVMNQTVTDFVSNINTRPLFALNKYTWVSAYNICRQVDLHLCSSERSHARQCFL